MRAIALAVLVVLMVGAVAHADDYPVPEQHIVGAENPVPLGELATLSLSPVKSPPANLATTSVTWAVFDGTKRKQFATDAEGRVFFGTGLKPKSLLVTASVTYVFVVKDGDKVKTAVAKTIVLDAEVIIGEKAPPSDPPVNPNPPSDPTPVGRFGLTKFIKDAAKGSPTGTGKLLGANFNIVSANIKAGKLKGYKDILKATKDLNAQTLANNDGADAWGSVLDSLGDKVFELFQAGTIKSDDDFAQAWAEVADAIR